MPKGKIVVWKDGTYKYISNGITWEYENDPEWFVTIDCSEINEVSSEK